MKNIAIALVVVLLGAVAAEAAWVAYNDTRPTAGDSNPADTTLWGLGGDAPSNTGLLKDFGGTNTAVTVTVVDGNVNTGGTGGPMPIADTDAYNIFNGKVDIAHPLIYYKNAGWYVDLEFTGLNPGETYTFASTHNRNNYDNRWSLISIQGADSSLYASSLGAHKVNDDTVSIVSQNTGNGYISQWTDIVPGADGAFTIHYTHASDPSHYPSGKSQDGHKAYGPASFMLKTGGLLVPLVSPPPPQSTGNWNVAGPADWMDKANWQELMLPSAAKVYIRNGGTAVLSDPAPNITEFDIENASIVNVMDGASLTGTGNWKIGDNAQTGFLIQTGGTLVTSGDIYLGDDDADYGEYRISGGSVEIGDDLKLGDDGAGLLVLSGTGQITVHGYIAVANKSAPSAGTFEISGGTLTQIGDGPDSGNARFTVADDSPATLRLIGGLATINVSNFEQKGGGTFEAIMDGTGISTINCVGYGGASTMTLDGDLIISFADSDPPPLGVYDLIVADSLVGAFANVTSDQPTVSWAYETGSAKFTIQVVPEPSTLVLGAIALLVGLVPFLRRRYRKKAA